MPSHNSRHNRFIRTKTIELPLLNITLPNRETAHLGCRLDLNLPKPVALPFERSLTKAQMCQTLKVATRCHLIL